MEALQRANEIRSRRAGLKRDLKAGRQPIDELLLAPPAYLETAKVFDLLLAAPKYGRVKVNKILTRCKISPGKTVGGLTERQQRELVAVLRSWRPHPSGPATVCPGCGGWKDRRATRCLGCLVTEAAR
jgi:hypothetical protein